ncbi:hypothetical protein GKQ38_05485 [Candidatus Nanohaloarchaea archaeon]|nr:hypothetical protein GKQ38_05485 [Candidatus Nanohaloarchaea archaeon]
MDEASHKVPDGKMVNIKLQTHEGVLTHVELRGDFFIEPAEKLSELEDALNGLPIDADKQDIVDSIESVDVELIGFSAEDIAEAIRKAMGE